MSLHRSPRPARALVAVAALALVALLASSCGVTDPDALVVDGQALSRSDLVAQLDALAAEPQALLALYGSADVEGEAPGTYSTSFTAFLLQVHVLGDVFPRLVGERGLTVTDDDRATASRNLASSGVTGELAGLTPTLVEILAAQQVVASDVQSTAVGEEALRALFDELPADQRQVACSSHILVLAGTGQAQPTEAEDAAAQAEIASIAAELAAGADFATVATARSDDTGSAAQGGSLGCRPRGTFVTEFDDAVWALPLGTTSEPVRTDFGYHIIRVDDRRDLTFEEAREDLTAALAQRAQAELQEVMVAALGQLDVTVDGQFGRWDAAVGQVVPPEGPEAPPSTAGADDLAELLGSTPSAP